MITRLYKTTIKLVTAVAVSLGLITITSIIPAYAASGVGAWDSTTALPTETFTASGATYNGYIYNVDGTTNAGDTNKVYYAKIAANGTIASWSTSANDLPDTFHRGTSVAHNGYLYVVGGYNATHLQFDTVYYAPLDPADGHVGVWNATTVLPTINQSEAVVINNNYMYVIGGGINGIGNVDTVYYAHIKSDGTLDSWTTSTNTLPQRLRRIGGVVNNNFVYITGGITTTGSQSNTVYYAPLNSDGSVGSWITSTNTLPTAVWDASVITNNGFIYNIGGQSAAGNINSVYYAPLNSDGSVGAWITSTNTLPDSINGAVGGVYNNRAYITGGSGITGLLLSSVYYAPLLDTLTQSSSVVASKSTTIPALANALGSQNISTLSIVTQPAHGTATTGVNGVTYTPTSGYTGSDSLVYKICSLYDAGLCSTVTLSLTVALGAPNTGIKSDHKNSTLNTVEYIVAGVTLFSVALLSRRHAKR